MYAESAGNPKARSHAGAMGLFQIMPDTLKWYQTQTNDIGDIYDPVYNEKVRDWVWDRIYKTKWVSQEGIDDTERIRRAAAAYNWGSGNLNKVMTKYGDDWINHLPKETSDYVRFIADGLDVGGSKTNEAYREWYDNGNQYIRKK